MRGTSPSRDLRPQPPDGGSIPDTNGLESGKLVEWRRWNSEMMVRERESRVDRSPLLFCVRSLSDRNSKLHLCHCSPRRSVVMNSGSTLLGRGEEGERERNQRMREFLVVGLAAHSVHPLASLLLLPLCLAAGMQVGWSEARRKTKTSKNFSIFSDVGG